MEITPRMFEYVEDTVKILDMRQDIFVKILEKQDGPTFDTWELERNWLSSFIANHIKVTGRNETNRKVLMEDNEGLIRDIYGYDGESADPADIVVAEELEAEFLKGLTELEKDIYAMVIGADICSYKEAAEILAMSTIALRKHVSRIKGKLNGKATAS